MQDRNEFIRLPPDLYGFFLPLILAWAQLAWKGVSWALAHPMLQIVDSSIHKDF